MKEKEKGGEKDRQLKTKNRIKILKNPPEHHLKAWGSAIRFLP